MSLTAASRALAACVLLMLVPVASARAQDNRKPAVTTGGLEALTPTSVTIEGAVNPRGQQTSAYVEYGPNGKFTVVTPAVDAGAGTKAVAVKFPISGLSPDTRYQYRVFASSVNGRTNGDTKRFTTPKVPVSVTLTAPAVVRFGDIVTISGVVGGTDGPGSRVQPEGRGFPFNVAFIKVGNPLISDGTTGAFAFTHQPGVGTQYRVTATVRGKPVTSEPITVGVAPRVTFRVQRLKRRRVRFHGAVTPSNDAVVRLRRIDSKGRARTVDKTVTRGVSPARYSFDARRLNNTRRWYVNVEPTNDGFAGTDSVIRRVRR